MGVVAGTSLRRGSMAIILTILRGGPLHSYQIAREREAVRRFGANNDVAVAVLGSDVVVSAHTPSPTPPTAPPAPASIRAHATHLPMWGHAPLSPPMKGHRP